MMTSSEGGYYDDKGQWQQTKFCIVSCGDRCNCQPPNGQYYSLAHDIRPPEEKQAATTPRYHANCPTCTCEDKP